MPLFYALVSRGKTVLAEHTARSGNFPTVTRVLLGKISSEDSKMSYVYDDYMFHYQVEDGITYLCLSDEKDKRRIAFLFLQDIKERFSAAYRDRAKTAIAFAMNTEFARVLADRMDFYNSNTEVDSISKVQNQLSEVKGIMMENIDRVFARGEKIEILVNKTDALNQSAKRFQKQSKSLKNAMWWKNVKMWLLIGFLVAIVIWLISSFACGFDYSKCRSSS